MDINPTETKSNKITIKTQDVDTQNVPNINYGHFGKHHKLIIALIIFAALVIAVCVFATRPVFVVNLLQGFKKSAISPVVTQSLTLQDGYEIDGTIWFRPEQVPAFFPSDIPFPPGVSMNNGYVTKLSETRYISTRAFVAKDSVQKTKGFYIKYLQNNNWKIAYDSADFTGNYLTITANKETASLVIVIPKNPDGKKLTLVKYSINQ